MSELNSRGTLYIVATPIGNLEDITHRAVRILRQADLIACEDTRQTRKLLDHYGISNPTTSYHEHNEAGRAEELLRKLGEGQNIALVSDAGMPGISDPGYRVIKLAIERGVTVIPIPGASAITAALVGSGLPTDAFEFRGFLPARSGQRRTALEALLQAKHTVVLYEAPHRIRETLEDVAAILGNERPVVVARELTKLHEEFIRGPASQVLVHFREHEPKGEITLLIGPASQSATLTPGKTLADRLQKIVVEQEVDEKEALKILARETGLPKSELYRELQRNKASQRKVRRRT
ncbi:MAG TPA: 16S rRNA (cytidine(1402)-2'-O)-methyltransferase [Candidatus Angelobacter sp.]|nr:16S rRNA (cytidine(1402)-2'-O)-methyltransferase [Candidatus Angelobacter sp.]